MLVSTCVIQKFDKLKDRSYKIVLETPELESQQLIQLDSMFQKMARFSIGENPIEYKDVAPHLPKALEGTKPAKSKSQRLRNIIRHVRNTTTDQSQDFTDYYNNVMEKIIADYQRLLEDY